MKKNLYIFVIAIIACSCNKSADTKTRDAVTTPAAAAAAPCTGTENDDIAAHGATWCDTDPIPDHIIDQTKYDKYVKNRWGHEEAEKYIYTADLEALIGDYKCYDKFISFVYDADAQDNSSIRATLVDCFDKEASCYSIPLIKKIVEDYRLTGMDVFEASIAKTDSVSHESVIFKVMDRSGIHAEYKYFDMSHFPK